MTTPPKRPEVIETFRGYLREHGSGAPAVGWGSESSQQKRFEVLNAVGDLNGASVLDIGCGLGDFRSWLKAHDVQATYTGVDITPEMILAAQKVHPGTDFFCGSLEEYMRDRPEARVDFAFASGIFYLDPEGGYDGMFEILAKMFTVSRKGVAFNSLSSAAERRDQGEFYADPGKTFQLCRNIAPWVTLRHDYHPADFTCYLYREAR